MKINKKLLDIFKTTKTTSDEYTYTCSYINDALNETYSTNEVKTNKVWIDGKPIYRKVINLGVLPNSSYIEVNTNLTNVKIVKFDCYAYTSGLGALIKTYQYQNADNNIRTSVYSDKVRITTTGNFSTWEGYAILEYTKTTD